MFKVLCLFAVVVVVCGMPQNGPVPMPKTVKRETQEPSLPDSDSLQADGSKFSSDVEGQDDMDKAETFGFGYHHYYGYPRYYYPSYYYGYYPRYYYGYYW